MLKNLVIRPAVLSEIPNLVVLRQQVWIATYADEGIRDEFSKYVLSEFTEQKMAEDFAKAGTIILVAEHNAHLIGYVRMILNSTCPVDSRVAPEITTLYVLERFLGKGIGFKLLQEAESYLKHNGFDTIWLDVFCENERAIRFYERQSFERIGISYFEEMGAKYENIVMMKEVK